VPSLDMIQTLIEYDIVMSRRVWESILSIRDEHYLQEDKYSRGSIRNLMIHLASTERRWLAGLKNEPDVGHLAFQDYPDRRQGKELFENVAADLHGYAAGLTEAALEEKPANIPATRVDVLLHLVNHGTDHRATVLQMLSKIGASTFEQDFITWLWQRERGE
jgi:uncharacterized damage-inducible protein DinB